MVFRACACCDERVEIRASLAIEMNSVDKLVMLFRFNSCPYFTRMRLLSWFDKNLWWRRTVDSQQKF